MNVLSNWGESAYAFEDAQVAEDGSLELEDESVEGGYGQWPSGDAGWTGRPSPPPPGPGGVSGSGTGVSWPQQGMASTPPYPYPRPSAAPSMPLNNYGNSNTGMLSGGNAGVGGAGSSYPTGPHTSVPGSMVGAQSMMPRRTSRVDLADPLPLDRRERMVLLLVDGRRSVADLARLTRRTEPEVRAVLGNLKMLGLIE